MTKRLTSGIVAAVAAISLSVPATGLATKGGSPHHTPVKCGIKHHYGKHTGSTKGTKKGSLKGNKCSRPRP